jgi:homoserine O-succinyltransferase
MPFAERHEDRLRETIACGPTPVETIWIKLDTRAYRTCNRDHIARHYRRFDEAGPLDALVVTGAAVDTLALRDVVFWAELAGILKVANENRLPVLGICWGAIAVGATLGVPVAHYPRKLFGVFETRIGPSGAAWLAAAGDPFWCPHSRYAGLDPAAVAKGVAAGTLDVLAYAPEAGDVIVATPDRQRVMHLGHPEYTAQRLVDEYERDRAAGLADTTPPRHVDLRQPQEPWLAHRLAFFGSWVDAVAARPSTRVREHVTCVL